MKMCVRVYACFTCTVNGTCASSLNVIPLSISAVYFSDSEIPVLIGIGIMIVMIVIISINEA